MMGEKRMLKDLRAEFLTQALQSKQSFWKKMHQRSTSQDTEEEQLMQRLGDKKGQNSFKELQ